MFLTGKSVVLLLAMLELGAALVLPPDYQEKIRNEIDAIQVEKQKNQIQLLHDFSKAREKFNNDWKHLDSESNSKIENVTNLVTEEYKNSQLDSVRNYWKQHRDDLDKANESDKFIDSYLQGGATELQPKEIINAAVGGKNYIKKFWAMTGPCVYEVYGWHEAKDDRVNEYEKKSRILKEAEESDILLENYLLN